MATPRRPWTRHPKAITLRRRFRLVDAVVGTLDGFRVHQSSTGSALVTYFGFISLFPLFLVFTTILGFVLESNEQLRDDIVNSALSKLPLIGKQLADSPDALKGSVLALVVGLLVALWSGTKAFVALQTALDNTNEVPIDERNSFVQVRLRALGGIVVVGLAQAGSAAINGVVAAAGLPAIGDAGLVVGTALLNAAVLSFTYRWLTSRRTTWRSVVPGSLFAGTMFSILQVLGTTIITRSQTNAENVYGDFTTTFTLLAWLSLHATVAMFGAELNRSLATSPYWSDATAAADPVPPDLVGSVDEDGEVADDGDGANRRATSGQPGVEAELVGRERLDERAATGVGVDLQETGHVEQSGDRGAVADVQAGPAPGAEMSPQRVQRPSGRAVGLGAVALLFGAVLGRISGRRSNHPNDRHT